MMIVDAAEFYNSVRSKCDLPCEHSIRIQRVITYPFQRNVKSSAVMLECSAQLLKIRLFPVRTIFFLTSK